MLHEKLARTPRPRAPSGRERRVSPLPDVEEMTLTYKHDIEPLFGMLYVPPMQSPLRSSDPVFIGYVSTSPSIATEVRRSAAHIRGVVFAIPHDKVPEPDVSFDEMKVLLGAYMSDSVTVYPGEPRTKDDVIQKGMIPSREVVFLYDRSGRLRLDSVDTIRAKQLEAAHAVSEYLRAMLPDIEQAA